MARSFLPPPVSGAEHPVTVTPGAFSREDRALLGKVGVNMAVAKARTEGRVPSPASRAYMFYTGLYGRTMAMDGNPVEEEGSRPSGAGWDHLRRQARETFRGLCAVFALRDVLGLEIALEQTPLIPDADPVSRVLLSTLGSAAGGTAYWQSVRYFTVRPRHGGEAEVLAGLSPLTGIFPAATPPRTALSGVFWYVPPAAPGGDGAPGAGPRWYDPTSEVLDREGGDFRLSPAARATLRGALRHWVQDALGALAHGSLAGLGVSTKNEGLFREELRAWAQELEGSPAAGEVVQETVAAPAGADVPAVFELTVRGLDGPVCSDFPSHQGRVVVTASTLADRSRRVWGRQFGRPEWGARVDGLPASGENLGEALGLGPHAVPVRYVAIDKLFARRLTFLTASGELSPDWAALPVANGPMTEYALLPFDPEILTILPADELVRNVSAELSQDNQHYIVRLRFGDSEVRKLYSLQSEGAYAVDDVVPPDALDVRLFPNFDLDAVRHLLPVSADGGQPDATYYARVRVGPDWPFDVRAFRVGGGGGPVAYLRPPDKRGSTHLSDPPGAPPPGDALFFTLAERPDGFVFGDRGFCLVRLRPPVAEGAHASEWEVGVDFGTSNTCVAVRSGGAPWTLDFPVLTTTLFARPQYTQIFFSGENRYTDEGASAAFDFFYKFQKEDRQLNEESYFPTQILTQQEQLQPAALEAGSLDLSAGLIYFRNVNLTGVNLLELTKEFRLDVGDRAPSKSQRFRLEQDIKWTRREWLRTFMAHLRKHVVLTAAHRNARVSRVRFSYPRAFTRSEEFLFRQEVKSAWGAGLLDAERPLMTESEAVRQTMAVDANQRVVFDVGGGTTDLIAFDADHPVFQSSFKLAARHLNGYVAASVPFREAFATAVREVRGEALAVTLDLFQGADRSEKEVLNAWVGLLQSLDDFDPSGDTLTAVVMRLQEVADGAEARAVRGFFLSAALLFGGLAFHAGRLLRAAAAGRFDAAGPFTLTGVTLTLTGNGSKLYRMLSPATDDFGPVFEGVFRRGLGLADGDPLATRFQGIYEVDGKPAPKVTVALGLLQQGAGTAVALPVADLVGEALPGEAGGADASLSEFYARVAPDIRAFTPPSEAPPEFAAFLDAMGEHLPQGRNGRHVVVPGAGKGWEAPLKGEVFGRAAPRIKDRVLDTVRSLGSDLDVLEAEGDAPSLEPLFVSELVAVLDQVREDHAG